MYSITKYNKSACAFNNDDAFPAVMEVVANVP